MITLRTVMRNIFAQLASKERSAMRSTLERYSLVNRDSSNVHPAALKMDEKQHVVGHQTAQREHLCGEEVGSRQQRQVGSNEDHGVVRLRSDTGDKPFRRRTLPTV